MIGKTVSHYRITEQLGAGGMGVVYKAEDTKLKRAVALKFLTSELTRDAEAKKRFIREAQAASALEHNNICNIHEINETEHGQLYIVMACYEGKTLKERLAEGSISVGQAINIAIQISQGLLRAHKEDFVHRDIKPANIIITDLDEVKILDFGLAKLAGQAQLTKDSSTLGTVAYMSPEQLSGKEVDQRADIWSLGVVLYEMITGELPFKGDYEQAVSYSIINEEPKLIKEFREKTPSLITNIIKKALQKNPTDRYQTIKDLLKELYVLDKSESSTQEKKLVPIVAVLPFTNMSADKEQEYFCDGIAEDILNDLTHLENLRIVARTSSFAFKDKNEDIREIGMKLGADTIVEGSVRKAGNRLRITAQLINVADGYHLWSERYDRELEDVFAIQDEIAKNIVQALEIKLSKREKLVLEKVNTKDVLAYDFYIRGRAYNHQGHRSSIKYAIDMFSRAIQKDENYALAYAGIADSYSQLYMYYDRNRENLDQALVSSQKALKLDPELAEAHSSMGHALAQNKQYKEAEKEFETAIQLNPKLFEAYYQYGRTCRAQGKHDQSAKLFEKATQVRPEDYQTAVFLAGSYNDLNLKTEMKKANQRALDVLRKHLDLNPDDARALYLGAGTLIRADESEEAIQWVQKAVAIYPNDTAVQYNAACIYSLLGKIEEALEYFEKAIDSGFSSKEWIDNDSDFNLIRNHSRFQKALKKLN